jgi:hypothetical protein
MTARDEVWALVLLLTLGRSPKQNQTPCRSRWPRIQAKRDPEQAHWSLAGEMTADRSPRPSGGVVRLIRQFPGDHGTA